MKIELYQVDMERDLNRIAFEGYETIRQNTGSIDSEVYEMVFSGDVDASDLEDIFRIFNKEHPEGYCGRSMSVSDVVVVKESANIHPGAYFCDNIGFKEIQNFCCDNRLFQEPRTLDVVIVEPGKAARRQTIGANLKNLQTVVGGSIERFCPFPDNACIVCNEEGKFIGLEPNRAVYDEKGTPLDVIFGTFFICASGKDDFISLTSEQLDSYEKLYRRPEKFISTNGQILCIPFEPEEDSSL